MVTSDFAGPETAKRSVQVVNGYGSGGRLDQVLQTQHLLRFRLCLNYHTVRNLHHRHSSLHFQSREDVRHTQLSIY